MPHNQTGKPVQLLLIAVITLASLYQLGYSVAAVRDLRESTTRSRSPLDFGLKIEEVIAERPEAAKAGIKIGDRLLKVNGQEFRAERILDDVVDRTKPGTRVPFDLQRPNGTRYTAVVEIQPIRVMPASWSGWMLQLAIQILLPVCCLLLGFWVSAARPYDWTAWLLLLLMISFSMFIEDVRWIWPFSWAAVTWHAALGDGEGAWLIWLFLFAVDFPERARFDVERPWLKWLLLVPLIAQTAVLFVADLGSNYSFAVLRAIGPLLRVESFPWVPFAMAFASIGGFFAVLARKASSASTPDARRRLGIVYAGTSVSLTPLFLLAIYGLIRGTDVFAEVPKWIIITAILFLVLFPLTLSYVIVVQRAMNVRMVVRQGVRYALAQRGLAVVRGILLTGAITLLVGTLQSHQAGTMDRIGAGVLLGLVIALRKRFFDRVKVWIDKRFFREAYSAEVVLSELSESAREFTEAGPLLATVADRVSKTLHVSRMAVFVKTGDRFCVSQTVGLETADGACFSPQARSVRLLAEAKRPELVYFDDPRSWVHAAEAEEQQKLRRLDAEVLLALPGRKELLGLVALGPKLSEEPYSPSDLRLLQSVAVQTGLALENTMLLQTVARETATRERLNREIEIAREVQQQLFPQNCPPVPGIDYFGMCRPALAVGGDYYDFIPRDDGRIGIALGDVSGKGISAALMMASMYSVMRGQIAAGLDDLALLLTNTNRLIYEASTSNRYVTFFYGEYNPATMRMAFVNAGHNAPIVIRGAQILRLEACGPVVGLLRSVSYESCEFQFLPGDWLVAYTDGISEAMAEGDEEWGEERMIEAIQSACRESAAGMAECLMREADAFTAGASQYDDMTVIALKVLEQAGERSQWVR